MRENVRFSYTLRRNDMMSFKKIERDAAKKHILLALEQFKVLPPSHDELIEALRSYFEDQKIEVFSRLIFDEGEEGFREFIKETVLQSGKYYTDWEDGQIRPYKKAV